MEIPWKRWKVLHNMNTRFFGKNIRYCSKFMGSVDSEYKSVNIVVWKNGFFEDQRTDYRTLDNVFEESKIAFLFLTTDNKWKFFCKFEEREMGKLIH